MAAELNFRNIVVKNCVVKTLDSMPWLLDNHRLDLKGILSWDWCGIPMISVKSVALCYFFFPFRLIFNLGNCCYKRVHSIFALQLAVQEVLQDCLLSMRKMNILRNNRFLTLFEKFSLLIRSLPTYLDFTTFWMKPWI